MTEHEHSCHRLQQTILALVDAGLFLDTHPQDPSALRYFNHMNEALQQATEAYERNFGPISKTGGGNASAWNWVNSPWPWEGVK
ncbi:MAG: spore coat protein CotJB [Butyricicoccus sp.]